MPASTRRPHASSGCGASGWAATARAPRAAQDAAPGMGAGARPCPAGLPRGRPRRLRRTSRSSWSRSGQGPRAAAQGRRPDQARGRARWRRAPLLERLSQGMNAPRTRAGFVAIVGAPNAGKSTLVNALVGSKVSIVSPKVQTTRMRVIGIAMTDLPDGGARAGRAGRHAGHLPHRQAPARARHGRRRLAGRRRRRPGGAGGRCRARRRRRRPRPSSSG